MPELPRRHYYRLDQAADFLADNNLKGADADYLLHLGATNRLKLCTLAHYWKCILLPSDYFAAGLRCADPDDPEIVDGKYPDGPYAGTEDDFMFSLDSSYHPKAKPLIGPVILQPHDLLAVEAAGQATIEACFPHDQTGKAYYFGVSDQPNTEEPKPVVTAEMLIVLHRDLQKMIEGVATIEATQTIPSKTRIHGNTENNAVKREQILKAAIACKEAYPDQCNNAEAWASCIDERAPLYWDAGEPPLARTTITDLLREAVKLPNKIQTSQ